MSMKSPEKFVEFAVLDVCCSAHLFGDRFEVSHEVLQPLAMLKSPPGLRPTGRIAGVLSLF